MLEVGTLYRQGNRLQLRQILQFQHILRLCCCQHLDYQFEVLITQILTLLKYTAAAWKLW